MIAPLLWSVPLELRSEEQRVNSGVVAHSEERNFRVRRHPTAIDVGASKSLQFAKL
jgi:hypothetical protein